MSNEVLDEAGVQAKFGVPPERIVDYLTLVGDTVDNVPGVTKCGPKTAVKWLTEYGTLDNLVAHADEVGGVVGENLRAALDWLPQGAQSGHGEMRCGAGQDVTTNWSRRRRTTRSCASCSSASDSRRWLREVATGDSSPAEEGASIRAHLSPSQTPVRASSAASSTVNDTSNYESILTEAQLDAWLQKLMAAPTWSA